jgi:hypothetical protein
MSLNRNACYLIVYHYETNAILPFALGQMANLKETRNV